MSLQKLFFCLFCFFFFNESNGSSETVVPFQERNPIISFLLNPTVNGLSQTKYTRLESYREIATSIAKAHYIWSFLESEDIPDLQRHHVTIRERSNLLKQVEESFNRVLQRTAFNSTGIEFKCIDFFYRELEIFSEIRKIELLEKQKARLILEKEITILNSESIVAQREIIVKDIEERRTQELEEQKHKTALLEEQRKQEKISSDIKLITEITPFQIERKRSKIEAKTLGFEEDKISKISNITVIKSVIEKSCEKENALLETSIAAEKEKQELSRVNQKYAEVKTVLGVVKDGIETVTTAVDSLSKSYVAARTPTDLYKAETERMNIERRAKLQASLSEACGIIGNLEFLTSKVKITDIKKDLTQNINKLKELIAIMQDYNS